MPIRRVPANDVITRRIKGTPPKKLYPIKGGIHGVEGQRQPPEFHRRSPILGAHGGHGSRSAGADGIKEEDNSMLPHAIIHK